MYWQKLNGLRHGRCWFGQFCLEWVFFKSPSFHLGFGIADYDCALSFAICLIFFSLYFKWENHKFEYWIKDKTKRHDQKYGNGREIKIYWHNWGIWWTLWGDPMESRAKDPWYVRMHNWNIPDILFGRAEYNSYQIKEEKAIVPMPEGGYPCLVKINRDRWKRPLWPFPRILIRSEIIPDKPIPFPGKGENAWDCGEDAMYSFYGPYDTALKAVIAASESVMRDRLKYGGGWNYKPKETI